MPFRRNRLRGYGYVSFSELLPCQPCVTSILSTYHENNRRQLEEFASSTRRCAGLTAWCACFVLSASQSPLASKQVGKGRAARCSEHYPLAHSGSHIRVLRKRPAPRRYESKGQRVIRAKLSKGWALWREGGGSPHRGGLTLTDAGWTNEAKPGMMWKSEAVGLQAQRRGTGRSFLVHGADTSTAHRSNRTAGPRAGAS